MKKLQIKSIPNTSGLNFILVSINYTWCTTTKLWNEIPFFSVFLFSHNCNYLYFHISVELKICLPVSHRRREVYMTASIWKIKEDVSVIGHEHDSLSGSGFHHGWECRIKGHCENRKDAVLRPFRHHDSVSFPTSPTHREKFLNNSWS